MGSALVPDVSADEMLPSGGQIRPKRLDLPQRNGQGNGPTEMYDEGKPVLTWSAD
jgi:hypothetical protein